MIDIIPVSCEHCEYNKLMSENFDGICMNDDSRHYTRCVQLDGWCELFKLRKSE